MGLLVAEKMMVASEKVLTEVLVMVFRRDHQDLAVEPALSSAVVSGLMRM